MRNLKTPYPLAWPNHYISLLWTFFLKDTLNIRFKKQTILKSSCAPPLCRSWSERWGRNALTEGDAALMVAEGQSRRNVPFPADLRLLQGCMSCHQFLSQVTSSIPFGLTTSEDMWRDRNNSQFHSCVEHKRQTKRKQGKRILKKTSLTW